MVNRPIFFAPFSSSQASLMKAASFGFVLNFFRIVWNAFLLGLWAPKSCEVKISLKILWFMPSICIFSIFSCLLSIVSLRTTRMCSLFNFCNSLLIPGVLLNLLHISFLSISFHSCVRSFDSPRSSNHLSLASFELIFPLDASFSFLAQIFLLFLRFCMPCFLRNFFTALFTIFMLPV